MIFMMWVFVRIDTLIPSRAFSPFVSNDISVLLDFRSNLFRRDGKDDDNVFPEKST